VKIGDVKRGVQKLTDSPPRITTDILWTVECPACGIYLGWTKVSKKPDGTDLGRFIEGSIPHQLNIPSALWRDIAGCTRGLDEYLASRGHSHPSGKAGATT
jgi:hypothetical protein